ncbi:Cof-type HAD-IIB family hydrolase [Pseudarthrobacter sp. J75]|uniref:Cof-type HAD-IIB family hydrolase n=1 Tax=unclassified Pseudarthrobacter TaxID=2647000 RepID=UPI002E81E8F4|nr:MULTISPECIES: Cof-type HAD-IIB family hydrolase [unclassified Pseudarthrobacter]MEE2522055.1 Cof-type HAD-IIB family hydrolase [Pseudarthrobacter sp. J47]MEE2528980.1 Cof-type HAD-IIB family hydrolase [Pseudarthrobacter sp. J75]
MRLVASDMDGTILGHDGRISSRTVRAFHACRAAGIKLVFVTGRPPRWLAPLDEQMGHTGTVICSNGAVVWDFDADRLISAQLMGLDDVLHIRQIIKNLRPSALFAAETLSGFHLEPGFIENDSGELLAEVTPAPLADTLTPDDGVVKFLAILREGTADDFLAEVAPAVGQLATVTHSAPGVAMLELSAPGVNKAVALAKYAESLGIDAADVVAFGDMPNDIEMLRWAGHGYAMASGHPDAIRAAGQVAPAFEDDGVAQILEARLAMLGNFTAN